MTDLKFCLFDFHPDILGSILEHVSFLGYVQLILTSNRALSILGRKEYYEIVWKSHFAAKTKAYEWHIPDEDLMQQGWRDIYYRMRRIKNTLVSDRRELFDSMYSLNKNDRLFLNFHGRKSNCLSAFGFEEGYFIPLLCLSQKYSDQFSIALEKREDHDMYLMCITKQLLHMQAFNSVYAYFESLGLEENADFIYERCLFELSKLNFKFLDKAFSRQAMLTAIRNRLQCTNLRKDCVKYSNEDAFHDQIQNIGTEVLRVISDLEAGREDQLCEMYQNKDSKFIRLAIIAKFLNEEVLRLPIRVDGVQHNFKASVTKSQVVIGSFRYKILEDFSEFESSTKESAVCDLEDVILSRKRLISLRQGSDQDFQRQTQILSSLAHQTSHDPVEDLSGYNFSWNKYDRVTTGRYGVVKSGKAGLVIFNNWADDNGNNLMFTEDDAAHGIEFSFLGSMELALPEDVKRIMSCGGFNLMGTLIFSKVFYRFGEYRFMETDFVGTRNDLRI